MFFDLQTELLSILPIVGILVLLLLVGGISMIGRLLSLPLYILFGMRRRGQDNMPTLVIENFQYNPDARDAQSSVLELVGRQPGWLVYQIMRLIGLPTEWKLRVTPQELHIKYSTTNGMQSFLAPLTEITTSDLRVEKPLWALWAGIVVLVAVIVGVLGIELPVIGSFDVFNLRSPVPAIIALAIGGLLLFWYWQRSRLVLAFSTMNISDRYGLAFRPKQFGDRRIDHETLLASIHHINHLVIESRPEAAE